MEFLKTMAAGVFGTICIGLFLLFIYGLVFYLPYLALAIPIAFLIFLIGCVVRF